MKFQKIIAIQIFLLLFLNISIQAQSNQFDVINDFSNNEFISSYTISYPDDKITTDTNYLISVKLDIDFSKGWENITKLQVDSIVIHHFAVSEDEEIAIGSTPIWVDFNIVNSSNLIFSITTSTSLTLDNKIFYESDSLVEVTAVVITEGFNIAQNQNYRKSNSMIFSKIQGPTILPSTNTDQTAIVTPQIVIDQIERYKTIRNFVIAGILILIFTPIFYKKFRKSNNNI